MLDRGGWIVDWAISDFGLLISDWIEIQRWTLRQIQSEIRNQKSEIINSEFPPA
jgi:hypothetical protein